MHAVEIASRPRIAFTSPNFNSRCGHSSSLNWTFGPGSAPNWYGVTINYQMDGDSKQDSYNIYLDNMTLSYQ